MATKTDVQKVRELIRTQDKARAVQLWRRIVSPSAIKQLRKRELKTLGEWFLETCSLDELIGLLETQKAA